MIMIAITKVGRDFLVKPVPSKQLSFLISLKHVKNLI